MTDSIFDKLEIRLILHCPFSDCDLGQIDQVTLDLARRLDGERFKVCEKSVHEYSKIPIDRPCKKYCCDTPDHHILCAIDRTICHLKRRDRCSSECSDSCSREDSCSSEERDYRRARRRYRRRYWRRRNRCDSRECSSEEDCSKDCDRNCNRCNRRCNDDCDSKSGETHNHHHISNHFFNLLSPTRFLPRIGISS